MGTLSLACIIAVLLQVEAAAGASEYPTTYPFSNDKNQPPALPATEAWEKPNNDPMSTQNPGGYINRFAMCDPYSDDRDAFKLGLLDLTRGAPAGFFECRAQAYIYYKAKGTQSPHETVNCTTKGASVVKWNSADISGKINGVTVCTDCCKHLKGSLAPRIGHDKHESALSDRASSAACPSLVGASAEPMLCKYVWVGYNCVEYFVGGKTGKAANNRLYTPVCYDVLWNYYSSCKLLISKDTIISGISWMVEAEPDQYYATLTNAQLLTIEPIFRMADRVCHPYSYYYPSKLGDGDGSSTPSAGFAMKCVSALAMLAVTVVV